MGDLRRSRHEQTQHVIADAAIGLFRDRGYDTTSMEDVAAAAGVSRRTLYRYFGTKDDLVFEHPRRWFVTLQEVIATRMEGESTRDLARRATLTVAEQIQMDPQPVIEAFAVLQSTPVLQARHGKSDADWIAVYVGLLLADLGDVDGAMLTAVVAASALTGATNGLIAVWAASPPGANLVSMTGVALDQLESIWPEQSR